MCTPSPPCWRCILVACTVALVVALVTGASPARAQRVANAASSDAVRIGKATSLTFTFENDLIGVHNVPRPPDYDYTSGLRLAATHIGAPRLLRRMAGRLAGCESSAIRRQGCLDLSVAITHQIFTPRTNSHAPIAGERPYAGWLFASVDVPMIRTRHSRTLGLDVGVIGPVTRAREIQNGWHRMFASPPRAGWSHQLANAYGVVVRYAEGVQTGVAGRGSAAAIDVHWGATGGNVINALTGGADVIIGTGGFVPWTSREPRVERPTRVYLLVGVQRDLVLRNVFIEGRPGTPGALLHRSIGQLQVGGGLRLGAFAMEYRHIAREREYDAQPAANAFGSLVFSVNRGSRR